MRGSAVALVVALCACGLADPAAPPGRVLVGAPPAWPGTPVPEQGRTEGPPSPPFPGYVLVWNDEFEGSAIDESRWNVAEGKWRGAVNSRDSVVVSGGVLSLVTFTDASGIHHAAFLHTQGKFEPRYGFFEARIQFLDSRGEWCAFWLWPKTMANPYGDPGTAGVEMDIVEHRDVNQEGYDVRDLIQVGLNWDMVDGNWKTAHQLLASPYGEPLSHAWHTYAALWTEEGTTFFIDDVPVWGSSAAVSHTTEGIFLTCEVENGGWAGYIPAGGYGPRERSTMRMEVDWVRAWQRAK